MKNSTCISKDSILAPLRPLVALKPALASLFLFSPAVQAGKPVEIASPMEISRLMGQWYEIASYPNFFQSGCAATTVEYGPRPGGGSTLKTRCRQDDLKGEWKESEGKVRVAAPGKLKVSFFWPFEGDYWVLAHSTESPDGWVLVGSPDREYLWVYSRKLKLNDSVYAQITERATALGFDKSQLRRTLQPLE